MLIDIINTTTTTFAKKSQGRLTRIYKTSSNTCLHAGFPGVVGESAMKSNIAPSKQNEKQTERAQQRFNVVVAAGNLLIQKGIVRYLSISTLNVFTETVHPAFLIDCLANAEYDVVIAEISTHTSGSLSVISAARQAAPQTKILALGDFTMPSLVKLIFKAGANGYLLSMPEQAVMVRSLQAIMRGEYVLDEQLSYIKTIAPDVFSEGL